MKLYLVSANGYRRYGNKFYVIGIFDNEDDALKAKETLRDSHRNMNYPDKSDIPEDDVKITEVELNKFYDFIESEDCNYINDHFIGGYVE